MYHIQNKCFHQSVEQRGQLPLKLWHCPENTNITKLKVCDNTSQSAEKFPFILSSVCSKIISLIISLVRENRKEMHRM